MERIASYENGNVSVSIFGDGTKIRRFKGIPKPYFPESLDCKITNYCDMGCKFCHEDSTTSGIHGDLNKLKSVLISLPAGIELALGGGNPLSHPDLISFLKWAKDRGLICNLTVNQGHLKEFYAQLCYLIDNDLIKGLGISIVTSDFTHIKELRKRTNNIVYHIIAGVHSPTLVKKLEQIDNNTSKVLILGYKYFGRGKEYYSQHVENIITNWIANIMALMNICQNTIFSFDNLALEQLAIQDQIDPKIWKQCFMGDDFSFTMYIDAVKQEYAPTSRSNERVSVNEMSLFEYFINNRNA